MQFGFAKNNAKAGGDIFAMSPTFRNRQGPKSLQKVLEHPSPVSAKTHTKNQVDPIPFPRTNYNEIIESESESQITRRTTRKQSSEHLAQIKALLEADDDGNQYSLEDGRETKLEFEKLKTIEMATALTAFIGAFMTVLTYDMEFDERDQELTNWMLWAILGSTIVTVFLNILRYFQKLKFQKARNILSKRATIFSTGDIWTLLIETIIIFLQPYPGLRGVRVEDYNEFVGTEYYYHVNDFFALLIPLRIFLVIRCVLNCLSYRSPRSQRISDMYGADSSYLYACRCIMKMAPIMAVVIIMVCSIGGFGYMIRVCERPLSRYSPLAMQFNTYWNAMWCVILTMTTVGYGDIYARTMLGRTVSLCMCIWGIFLVSLMVVTLTNILTMSAPEEKSLLVLRRLELRKGVKKSAAFILTNIAKIGLIRRKRISADKKNAATKEAVKDLKHHLNIFRLASREVKGLDDNTGAMEEVNRQIGFLREDVKTVMEVQTELQKTVQMLMGGGRSRYMDSRVNVPESKFNLHDFEEDVVIKQAK